MDKEMTLKILDVFGVSISCDALADIVWQGIISMEKEAETTDLCDARKGFLKFRIEQGKAVHVALKENCLTNK